MPIETIVTLDDMKEHLALTGDQQDDDMLIQLKLDAAQSLIERMLGYGLIAQFEVAHAVPPDLREAVMQLAAWWYENREAVMERGAPLPFGVAEIIDAHRDRSF
ncbi:phage gp6-like head-tail connector protein [Paracoccus gahaiensis]|uniref:Phage gp6-like head-tail connector protein n=1 Tax=Paracoccus gahaiensis TaxID=1706839 RepID=A0A4U0RFA0_9RHOB|nr:head-tail connector protein [Paracoccus gahaiensis]TJZ93847.1 phage gp6-like head-tail connector protein [Paracoccus gahaiensis]